MNKIILSCLCWLSSIGLLVINLGAFAFTTQGVSWSNDNGHYNLSSSNSTFDIAFIEAMNKWNGQSNFSFSSSASGYRDPCGSNPDNTNSHRFSTNNCGDGWNSSTLAVTISWFSGSNLIDTDIIFNSGNFSWSVYDGSLGSSIDFRRVAVHELGHALGLGHSSDGAAIMQPTVTNTIISPQADDINGMRAIYGGSGGGFGNDFFVQNSSLSESSVLPGNTTVAQTEQHYTGSSSTTLLPIVGYYLSSNTSLGSSDTLLGTDSSTLSISDTEDDESATITIPSSTAPGAYYILFVADHDDQLIENNENNNIQAVAITVTTPQRTLSVSVSGSGNITSSPSGINCPSDCSQQYAQGTSVTLTPQASAGWRFKEWGGSCSGSGACSVSMTSSKSVSAVFVKRVVVAPIFLLLLDDE